MYSPETLIKKPFECLTNSNLDLCELETETLSCPNYKHNLDQQHYCENLSVILECTKQTIGTKFNDFLSSPSCLRTRKTSQ
jgi:hypothetical protein